MYLVSGDENIRPSDDNLRRTGRRVRFDDDVDDDAAVELREGKAFVVLAHGQANGTIKWFKSSRGSSARWLWVGMPRPPRRARLYLYSCHAGRRLPHFLKHCEAFGHVDVVPMPVGEARDAVLGFLTQVDWLVSDTPFDFDEWRGHLAEYVNRKYAAEVENPTGISIAGSLLVLRRSLGYDDS